MSHHSIFTGITAIRRLQKDFRWPEGQRVAVVFNVAYEGWSDGKAPGIGPMGNPLQPGHFDTNAHSWGHYGTERGVGHLLDVADRHGVKTSVMVCGVLAEKFPHVVRDIHQRGHEIVAHSYGMDVIPVYLDADAERKNIQRTTALLREATGATPPGWISPRGTGSVRTPELLAEAGYVWHGDVNDDDAPYLMELGERRIAAVPLTMDVNDLPWSMRYGNAPRGLVEVFNDTLASALDRIAGPVMIDVTAHAHCYGRPWGLWAYEEMMRLAKRQRDVWIATRIELAQAVREHFGR
jgi:peptidoglycan/xylan/chitin deacetylase (PgdA/CDA1 family)